MRNAQSNTLFSCSAIFANEMHISTVEFFESINNFMKSVALLLKLSGDGEVTLIKIVKGRTNTCKSYKLGNINSI